MSDAVLVRCARCNGGKKIMGMGMLQKPCPDCSAIGWIEVKPIEPESAANEAVIEEPKTTKKKEIKKHGKAASGRRKAK
jgi:phage FluMu protein Com